MSETEKPYSPHDRMVGRMSPGECAALAEAIGRRRAELANRDAAIVLRSADFRPLPETYPYDPERNVWRFDPDLWTLTYDYYEIDLEGDRFRTEAGALGSVFDIGRKTWACLPMVTTDLLAALDWLQPWHPDRVPAGLDESMSGAAARRAANPKPTWLETAVRKLRTGRYSIERRGLGCRYMGRDWEFNWDGLLEFNSRLGARRHFFRVVSHPLRPGEDWGGGTWGNSGALSDSHSEEERRAAIAAKCWDIIDNEPGITFGMVQEALREIDLELIRTPCIAPRQEETG